MIADEFADDQGAIQSLARRFALDVVGPLSASINGVDRDGHTTRDEFRALFAQAADLGFPGLLIPERFGGAGRSCVENAIVQEELGAVDAGIGAALNLSMTVSQLIVEAGTDDQRSRWLPAICGDRDHILAGALNEPDVAGSELMAPTSVDPSSGIRSRAVRDGDDYVITGTKVPFVTNGGVAKAYFVFARTSFDRPAAETATIFYVPADAPGLTVGARTELLGLRSSWHAEVVLDSVRVSARDRIGEEGQAYALMATTAPMAIGLAATFVGVAQAATSHALAWANERVSGGQPIRRHQAVALRLADMAIATHAARLLVRDAAAAYDAQRWTELAVKVPAAKSHAVDVAISVAGDAVRILGGAGVARGMPAERLLRDAWTGYACDFTGDMLRLGVADAL